MIIWLCFKNSKWITPLMSHHRHNKICCGWSSVLEHGIELWPGDNHCLLRFGILHRTHFSAPVTDWEANWLVALATIHKCSFAVYVCASDKSCGIHLPRFDTFPISWKCLWTMLLLLLNLTTVSAAVKRGSASIRPFHPPLSNVSGWPVLCVSQSSVGDSR